ncbi:hypothetical protein BI040_gp03 [Escherichia phage vB_EcoS_NBD2]|uniref:Uncharacterized protein n=1 Tax=Escherichia phage vB_EcoS_NBD2 TaxID=1852563 RepID=A0A192Y9F3_9CAUD|nr:hypothetical protein BI040_gp03 [Escherichia phage vB_EcoS_NBD2]ANM45845.1 hypothetical protein NBD2_03 [Escherichia phage vB_EcoS_NBD2]
MLSHQRNEATNMQTAKLLAILKRIDDLNAQIFSGSLEGDELTAITNHRNQLALQYMNGLEEVELVKPGERVVSGFAATVLAIHKECGIQLRYAAFMADSCDYTIVGRGAEFMAWIASIKAKYKEAHPGWMYGADTIGNQHHFTSYIVSGAYMVDSTNC